LGSPLVFSDRLLEKLLELIGTCNVSVELLFHQLGEREWISAKLVCVAEDRVREMQKCWIARS
jgi:hypothetical protein